MAELTPERMKEIGESIDLLTVHAKEGDVPWSCYEAMLDLYHAVQAKDTSIAKLLEAGHKFSDTHSHRTAYRGFPVRDAITSFEAWEEFNAALRMMEETQGILAKEE
jgi:hypothetical protein